MEDLEVLIHLTLPPLTFTQITQSDQNLLTQMQLLPESLVCLETPCQEMQGQNLSRPRETRKLRMKEMKTLYINFKVRTALLILGVCAEGL